MQQIIWEVQYLSPPQLIKYCKKCGKKNEFYCSGLFRVNAQRKYLDIWLIYKCSDCDFTYNLTVYSRINPKSLASDLLERFCTNDTQLAIQCAMNIELLKQNEAEFSLPQYKIVGEDITVSKPISLSIISQYPSQLKVSMLLRDKLGLSQKIFNEMLDKGLIKSVSGLDLKKCKLQNEITLTIGCDTSISNK